MRFLGICLSSGLFIRVGLHDAGWLPMYPLGQIGAAVDFILAGVIFLAFLDAIRDCERRGV